MTRREFLVEVGGLVELPKLGDRSFAEVIGGLPSGDGFECLDDCNYNTETAEEVMLRVFNWMYASDALDISSALAWDYFNECSRVLSNTTYMYFCSTLTNGPTLKAASEQGPC